MISSLMKKTLEIKNDGSFRIYGKLKTIKVSSESINRKSKRPDVLW